MKNQIWKNGIMGVIIGDALGCPVQFLSREKIAENPVTEMTGFGTYNMPVGTWTDDGSMTVATLDSIRESRGINLPDIMYRFACWLTKGDYTPFGECFDNGGGTTAAILRYMRDPDVTTCGGRTDHDNGNGALMRIMPVCLYCYEQQKNGKLDDAGAIRLIHQVSGLTHNHLRGQIACGLYYFMVRAVLDAAAEEPEYVVDCGGIQPPAFGIVDAEADWAAVINGAGIGADAGNAATIKPDGKDSLKDLLAKGLAEGFTFYRQDPANLVQLAFYGRLEDLNAFGALPAEEIRSSGYVLDTLEAVVWSLLNTDDFRDALLLAVNLGDDTDTVGAICGGLAGLFYGYDAIPEEWLAVIQKREWIETLCGEMDR